MAILSADPKNVIGGSAVQKRARGRLEPTLGRQVVGGLIKGASNDLVAGPIMDLLIDVAPGIDDEYMEQVYKSIEGKTAAKVAEFVGEFGVLVPQIATVAGVGRAAAGAVLRAAATAGGKRGMLAGTKLATKALDIGGDVAKALPKLKVERAAEMVGANAAIGGFFGVEAALQGAEPREALEHGAIAAIIGGAFETGVAAFGLMTKAGRSAFIDQNKFRQAWESQPIGPKGETAAQLANTVVQGQRNRLLEIRDGIHKLLNVDEQVEELVKTMGQEVRVTKTVTRRRKPSELSETKKATKEQWAAVGKLFGADLRGRVPKGATEARLYQEILQKARGEKWTLQASRRFEQLPRIIPLVRRGPFSPSQKRAELEQALTWLVKTPESWTGSFGSEALGRLGQGLLYADNAIVQEMAIHAGALKQLREGVVKTLGLSKRDIRNGKMLDYAAEFERGDVEGLKAYLEANTKLNPAKIERVTNAFDQLSKYQTTMYKRVLQAGGRPMLTEAQLASRDVKRFLTHIGENLDEDDMIKYLMDHFGDREIAWRLMRQMQHDPIELEDLIRIGNEVGVDGAKVAAIGDLITPETLGRVNILRNRIKTQRGPRGTFESRMPKFGAFDFTRTLRGTLKDKYEVGLPVIVDPFDAALRFSNAASRRWHIGRVIGQRGELLDDALDVAQAEGVNTTLARNVFSEYLDNKYYSQAMREFAKFATGVNVASKMTLGVLANMSQTSNTIMTYGMKNLLKGFKEATVKENRIYMEQMLALNHSMMTTIGRVLGEEGLVITGAEKLAELTLRFTGFSAVERINRLTAGFAGYAAAKDIIAKGALGKLRGNTLDKARRQASQLGFSLDDAISTVRATNRNGAINRSATLENLQGFLSGGNSIGKKILDDSAFMAAQKTQFIPSKMRRPLKWNHPLGRVAFQFKTFALQQGRLLRDQVFGEAAAGNMAPMAYFLSVAPIAGELVGDMKAFVKDAERTDNLAARAVENFTYLGGFGLFTDLWQSTYFGDFSGAVFGPTFGTVEDIAVGLANMDASLVAQPFIRMPATQAAYAFYRAYDHTPEIIDKYVNLTSEAEKASRIVVMPPGALTQQDVASKRGRP